MGIQDSQILSLGDMVKANFLSISLKPTEMNEKLKKKIIYYETSRVKIPKSQTIRIICPKE